MNEPEPDIAALQERIRLLEFEVVHSRVAMMQVLSVAIDIAVVQTMSAGDLKDAKFKKVEDSIEAISTFVTSSLGGDTSVE